MEFHSTQIFYKTDRHLSTQPDPDSALCGAVLWPLQPGRRRGRGDGRTGGNGPLRIWDLPPLSGERDHTKEWQAEEPRKRGAPCLSLSSGDRLGWEIKIKSINDPQHWYHLESSSFWQKNSSYIIELKLILKAKFSIQPAASRITVVVLKARNLPKMDITGLSGLESYSLYIVRNHLTSSLDIKGLIGKG